MDRGTLRTVGYDIGGAHLKAAMVVGDRVTAVVQEPCALWQGLDRLEAAFAAVGRALGTADRAVATMTGELVDLFATRAEGVAALAKAAERHHPGVTIYAGADGFVPAASAADHVDRIASANWHATAALVARRIPDALVLDIGSTTTDLVPIRRGDVAARALTDADRLAAGELVYTGATRTPLMAVAAEAPVAGRRVGVMAEYFATMADANRLLDRLPEGADQHPTADGRGKTAAESRSRIARMVGRDVGELDEAGWRDVAAWFAEAQVRRIHDAAVLVASACGLPAKAPIVACGIGRAAIDEIARRLGRPVVDWTGLLPVDEPARSWAASCAPAVAVAILA